MTPLPDEAWALLVDWLPSNDDPERPQITLSTVDPSGDPDARTVLLSEFDRDGFSFHTDRSSRKARDIAVNSAVALTVLWPGFTHQLVVRGRATVAADSSIAAAYTKRSPYLQQLAWLNSHDFAALPREERVEQWAAFEAAHPDGFEQAPSWTGYVVRPTRLTFWSSNGDTASRRVEFAVEGGAGGVGWSRRFLAG